MRVAEKLSVSDRNWINFKSLEKLFSQVIMRVGFRPDYLKSALS